MLDSSMEEEFLPFSERAIPAVDKYAIYFPLALLANKNRDVNDAPRSEEAKYVRVYRSKGRSRITRPRKWKIRTRVARYTSRALREKLVWFETGNRYPSLFRPRPLIPR